MPDSALRGQVRVAALLLVAVGLVCGVPGPAQADEIRDSQWHLDALDIVEAHRLTRGEGVTVAVIDSGVDHRHPDLTDALLKGRNFSAGRRDGWQDPTGHGTGMAAMIAGRGHGPGRRAGVLGIAPEAKILPVRVKSGGPVSSPGALERGIEWAAEQGADILSISLTDVGYPGLEEAVRYAERQGTLIVASAGNTASGDREVRWPARYPGVVAVSGTDPDGNFTAASVSGPEVVLSAPAAELVTATSGRTGGYSTGTGTSGAAAMVAGVAALVKARYPELDAANVINRLIATSEDRGPAGRDPRYGYGVVDPVAALTARVPRVTDNPLLGGTDSTSGRAASGRPGAAVGGLGPVGGVLIAVGALAALTLTVTAVTGLVRRRRVRVTGVQTVPRRFPGSPPR